MSELATVLAGASTVAVSGALDPDIRTAIVSMVVGRVETLPVVRGRSVTPVTGSFELVIGGAPNHLGRIDHGGPGTVLLWDPALAARPSGRTCVVGDRSDDGRLTERTELACYIAKRLCQIRGAAVAWTPETPVAIVMLPFDPASGLPALEPGFAGIPSALRIVVEPGTTRRASSAYAAHLEAELERGRRA